MTLALLMLIPLAGALVVGLGPERQAKWLAFAWSLLALAVGIVAAFNFNWAGNDAATYQFAASWNWIDSLGVRLSVGADSVAMLLILLTVLLGPICIAGSFTAVTTRPRLFYASLLVLQAAMTGVFASRDIILFYLCFEFTLAPMFVLIREWGSTNRRAASIKFFLYTFTGSILTLAGLVYVAWFHTTIAPSEAFAHFGQWSFEIDHLLRAAQRMSAGEQFWVLLAMLAGFAVKVPVFPVHTWLPLAHTEAPTAGSVILAGVLLKLGTYGLYRFAIPFAPQAIVGVAPALATLALIGIIYAGLVCWAQRDVKKLVAYSSVSHLGFCVLGLAALNMAGATGSVLYMINHGLSTGALFLCIGMIYERYHTRSMDELGGLAAKMPVWAFFMVFFTMASVGLPGLNGFVSEFLTMLGAFQAGAVWGDLPGATGGVLGPIYGSIAASGVIIAAIYLLYMVGRIVFGPLKEPDGHGHHDGEHTLPTDLSLREILVLSPLAVLCLVLGLYPTPVLHTLEAPTRQTLSMVQGYLPGADEPEIPEEFRVAPQVSEVESGEPTPVVQAPASQEAGL
ncbi:MAG: NuoM family protein [Phycisphaerales bacterium]